MSRNKQLAIVLSVLIYAVVSLTCVLIYQINEKPSDEPVQQLPPQHQKISVTLKAVGDNLIHSPIYESCQTVNGFDFDDVYVHITPHIKEADIAAINQETIFVNEAETFFSGYPSFGTPQQVGESAVRAGFNTITHATNHAYDRGKSAMLHTMDFWNQHSGVTVLGINKTAEEQQKVQVWEKDGLRIAMLNFTYGLNGGDLPGDRSYLVNVLDCSDKNAELLSQAEETADITVVFMHFGTEYHHTPSAEQKRDVEFLTVNGADVIIGTHPHVIQPLTEHTAKNGNKSVVFYSLGNFLSNQSGTEKILGGMASVTISKEKGKTLVEHYEMLPTVSHRSHSDGKYSVFMLSDYTDTLASDNRQCDLLTVEKLQNLFDEVMAIEVYN